MSGHLPECDWNNACHLYKAVRAEGIIDRTWQKHNDHYKVGKCVQCGVACICDRLRACEERMRAACISAVEAQPFWIESTDQSDFEVLDKDGLLAALREVQP